MSNITNSLWDIKILEKNAQKETALHQVHALAKLAVTFCYIVCVVACPKYDLGALLVYAVLPLFFMLIGEVPPGQLFKRLLIVLPFAAAACAANLFLDTDTALMLGSVPVSYGVLSFLSVILKTILTVSSVLILIATTQITQLVGAMSQLHVPDLLSAQFLLVYRYVDVLFREAAGMYHAYKLHAPGQKGIRMQDMGSFLGGLLLRTINRAERIYHAIKCRGFHGNLYVSNTQRFCAADSFFIILLCTGLILLRIFPLEQFLGGFFVD